MNTMNGKSEFQVSRNIMRVLGGTALILMVPLLAMQFTNEVDWTLSDFIIMGVLLSGTGLLFVLFASLVKTAQQRWVIGIILFIVLFFTWVELAVGLLGTPFAGS